MSQPNVFLVKSISEIVQLLPKKHKGRLGELAATFQTLHKSSTLSADLAAHKQECIVPIIELAQESFVAKQFVLCNKTLDLIEKLIRVSMETMEIIDQLPPVSELPQPANWPFAWKADA